MTPELAYAQIKSIGTADSVIINHNHHWHEGKCYKKWAVTVFSGANCLGFIEHESLKMAVQIIGAKIAKLDKVA